jgi:hypothetical protein
LNSGFSKLKIRKEFFCDLIQLKKNMLECRVQKGRNFALFAVLSLASRLVPDCTQEKLRKYLLRLVKCVYA